VPEHFCTWYIAAWRVNRVPEGHFFTSFLFLLQTR
jgi:hypothetical protein